MLKYLIVFIVLSSCFSAYSQFKVLRISDNIGYGFMTGEIQSDLPNSIERQSRDLKLGNFYEIDVDYGVNDVWGFGLTFKNFHSDASAVVDGVFFEEDFSDGVVDVDTDIELNFIAPKLYFLLNEEEIKHQFVGNLAIGYLRYESDTSYSNKLMRVSASTIGLSGGFDYEYRLTSFLYLTSRLSALVSFVTELEVKDGSGKRTVSVDNFSNGSKQRENLSSIGLTVGVRVNIAKPRLRSS